MIRINYNTRLYRTLKTIITFLLCVVVIFQVINKAVFTHTHLLDDGTMVTHAHPYDKHSDSSPYKHHHHSKFEITFFLLADLLFFVSLGTFTLRLFSKNRILYKKHQQTYISCYTFFLQGRSPPDVVV